MAFHSPPPPEQLSSRERLLDAAIRLFGQNGFEGTSVRAIGDEAGVSWALIRFYFGSKEGVREAADERAIRGYLDAVHKGHSASSYEQLASMLEVDAKGLSETAGYLRRAILEERPIALDFLRQLLETTEVENAALRAEYPDEPVLWDPVRQIVQRMGYLLLAPQILTLSGRDVFSTEELKRRNEIAFRSGRLLREGLRAERRDPSKKKN
ncbi:MAG TPA: TetR family transcriptional regulator [Caulobacteraceae bacterium]|jgi:AcrR family transcriptional regulator|nr:TetR family transcriptional regulator [Caulobacteraceae bacterium]